MTNTKTEDVAATVAQIQALETAGCDIIRCAVPTLEAAEALEEIKKQISIPLVADIHFDYRLALAAIEHGADKIRINPGNIGSDDRVRAVVEAARERSIPIRVGVNSGSLEKTILEKYHGVTAEGLVESALSQVKRIEDMGYDNLVISIKASDVRMCARAHELIAEKTDHPLHVGITEAGTLYSGNIKSAVGLGIILYQGIGDTIRVSLTGDPLEEIKSAKRILKTLGLRRGGVEVVSCPTCGRTQIDLIGLANQVETMVQDIPLDIKVGGYGMRGQRTGRSPGSRSRNCGRKGSRPADPKRRSCEKGSGSRISADSAGRAENGSRKMEIIGKEFLAVFPRLQVEGELAGLLGTVRVARVAINKKKDLLRVYLVSSQWIHKKHILSWKKK